MKTSLALRPRRSLSRAEAWGCFTANLALPGAGSLMAGRWVGYPQLVFTTIGLVLTMTTGLTFISWFLKNWEQINSGASDPIAFLHELWIAVRWPLLGIALFLIALTWAMITSLLVFFQSTPPQGEHNVPPKLPT